MASFKEHVKMHLDSAFRDIKDGFMKGIAITVQDIDCEIITYDENHIYCVEVGNSNNEVILQIEKFAVIPFKKVF